MTYEKTINYLYQVAPLFQQNGAGAYKPGLQTTETLDAHFNHPHRCYKTIHVAGTNGKGSVSHTLAAVLQAAGMKVGLYTSPHLMDFRERIRVNGEMIPEKRVIDFVEQERSFFEPLYPSFFELTTALAFEWFAEMSVDVAVIEVGLGGRLDCTNIITPEVSIITNISLDHTDLLGHSLKEIAKEKAGIIKKGVPVVIGEAVSETRPVFEKTAAEMGAPLYFAEEEKPIISNAMTEDSLMRYETRDFGVLLSELVGDCQQKNAATILTALKHLSLPVAQKDVAAGFRHVTSMTGLMGRWQTLQTSPCVVCDTGHNVGGWQYLSQRLERIADSPETDLHIVFGMVGDKDISGVLSMLPHRAQYYFCQASVKRALPAAEMQKRATQFGLRGEAFDSVSEAYQAALAEAHDTSFVFVGGSSFVVADLLVFLRDSGVFGITV